MANHSSVLAGEPHELYKKKNLFFHTRKPKFSKCYS